MKKRIRRGDPQRRTYWEEVLRRWREGGQAVRVFCRAEGVRESAFYFWRRELAQRDPQAAGDGSRAKAVAAGPASRKSARHGGSPSFLPVRVVEPDVPQADCEVEIVLAHGRVVRVRADFDRQTLADVLGVLEARPC